MNKRRFQVGVNLFNKYCDPGITYLIKHGLLTPPSPTRIAQFLIQTKNINKNKITQYLINKHLILM